MRGFQHVLQGRRDFQEGRNLVQRAGERQVRIGCQCSTHFFHRQKRPQTPKFYSISSARSLRCNSFPDRTAFSRTPNKTVSDLVLRCRRAWNREKSTSSRSTGSRTSSGRASRHRRRCASRRSRRRHEWDLAAVVKKRGFASSGPHRQARSRRPNRVKLQKSAWKSDSAPSVVVVAAAVASTAQ